MIKLIVARTINNIIGLPNGDLPFRLKADMMNFKRLTTDNFVLMGRKTFDTFPNGVLPNRQNIIVTRSAPILEAFESKGLEHFRTHRIKETMHLFNISQASDGKDLYIIGGEQIYNEALASGMVDECIVTVVDTEVQDEPGCAKFFMPENYMRTSTEHHDTIDADNHFKFRIDTFKRVD